MKAFVVAFSGILLSTTAVAQVGGGAVMSGSGAVLSEGSSQVPEEAEAASAAEGDGAERRICRRVETASGSRMSYRRLCMTAEQWRAFNRAN